MMSRHGWAHCLCRGGLRGFARVYFYFRHFGVIGIWAALGAICGEGMGFQYAPAVCIAIRERPRPVAICSMLSRHPAFHSVDEWTGAGDCIRLLRTGYGCREKAPRPARGEMNPAHWRQLPGPGTRRKRQKEAALGL